MPAYIRIGARGAAAGTWGTPGAPTEPMTTTTTFPPCPACGSTAVVRIVYGYPNVELGNAERRGEIVLGGCLVGPESPAYECRICHAPLPWVGSA
jgi:hypothetical protein